MRHAGFILFVTFFLAVSTAYAQRPGYIITLKNDTIRGLTQGDMFTRLQIKTANSLDFKKVRVDTIKEYQYTRDSSVFVVLKLPVNSMNLVSSPQFVQRLAHGKIDLFEQVSGRYALRTWYVSKNADSLVAIKTDDMALIGGGSKQKRRDMFAAMLSDKPEISNAFNAEKKFSFDTILLYVKRYNQAWLTPGK